MYDDRLGISPGFKFKDADLLGMPFQVIVGEKNLTGGKVEIKHRAAGTRELVEEKEIVPRVRAMIGPT